MAGKYRGMVKAPKNIKIRGQKHTLSYINPEEERMLLIEGGSGEQTKYGVKAYSGHPGSDEQKSESANIGSDQVWDTVTTPPGDPPSDNGDDPTPPPPPPPPPIYETGTKPRLDEFKSVNLMKLKEHADAGTLNTYLENFDGGGAGQETTMRGNQQVITTYTYETLDHGLEKDSSDNYSQTFDSIAFKDKQGNTIGWNRSDGSPQMGNKNQWEFDSDSSDWVYVGEGAVGGGGGEGNTEILGPDGTQKTVGARTYAAMLGYDQDKLNTALEDRASMVTVLKQKQEQYGGTYDEATGEFKGGLEQKHLAEADIYDAELKSLMGISTRDPVTGEITEQADTFWQDMEKRAGELPTDMQQRLFGTRADEIVAQATDQTAQLRQTMAERGIDPTSPQAMRMERQLSQGASMERRQAKRQSLGDAMMVTRQMRGEQMQTRGARMGMIGAKASEEFQKGTYYGGQAIGLTSGLMEEAVDRQRGQESMKLAGTTMKLAKYGAEKDRELSEKIAAMKSSYDQAGGGGGGGGGSRFSFGSAMSGAATGFKLSGGNPWVAAAGGIMGFMSSDRKLKKKVRSAKPRASAEEIDQLLKNLKAYNYEYKNSKYGSGRRLGVMAQDLEKTRLGKKIVVDTPVGKAIDIGKGLGLALATQAHLNKKIKNK